MKNEPVMNAAAAIAAIWALVMALWNWYFKTPVPNEVQAAMVPAILAAGFLVRQYVTPLSNPRTEGGRRLVPESPTTASQGGNGEAD